MKAALAAAAIVCGAAGIVRADDAVGMAGAGADAPLSRGRDLAGVIERSAAGSPGSPATGGVGLWGLGQGELPLEVDGIDLTDPGDGTAPLELPLSLFEGVQQGDEGSGPWAGLGGLRLSARRSTRRGERFARVGGGVAGPPRGEPGLTASPDAFVEVGAGEMFAGGRVRVSLMSAPRVEARAVDQASAAGPGFRRRRLVPSLVRVDGETGAWRWKLVGLTSFEDDLVDHSPRIVTLGSEDERRRLFQAFGAEVRRARGVWEGRVAAHVVDGRTRVQPIDGEVDRLDATRAALRTGLAWRGDLGGTHVIDLEGRLAFSWGRLRGLWGTEARRGASAAVAEAFLWWPALTVSERFSPQRAPWLTVGGALDVVDFYAQRAASPEGGVPVALPIAGRVRIAPRAYLLARSAATGWAGWVGGGRVARRLPLVPVLGSTEAPAAALHLPYEDVIEASAGWGGQGGWVSATALGRRAGGVIEDRFSSQGRLVLGNPPDAHRTLHAVLLQAGLFSDTTRVGIAYRWSSLQGTWAGAVDPIGGRVGLGATRAFDAPGALINGDGPLPLDRTHVVRVSVERWGRWGQTSVRGGAFARLDDGAPLSALGRSALAGPGQVFVAERGSLGRGSVTGSLDAALTVSRDWRRGRVLLGLEAFNLTHQRRAIAYDEIYSDNVVEPRAGAGAARLADTVGPSGQPVTANPAFLAATAYEEPLLVRLVLGIEL